MKLKEWMDAKEINSTKMAKDLDCSKNLIDRIRIGYPPGRKTAEKIVRYTNGEVTIQDLYDGDNRFPFISVDPGSTSGVTFWFSKEKIESFQISPEIEIIQSVLNRSNFKHLVIEDVFLHRNPGGMKKLIEKKNRFVIIAQQKGIQVTEINPREWVQVLRGYDSSVDFAKQKFKKKLKQHAADSLAIGYYFLEKKDGQG